MTSPIPFDQIKDVSLAQIDRLLFEWFPNGKLVGREFQIGNIHGDAGESLKVNLKTGKWKDFADQVGGYDLIDLRAAMVHAGNRVEAARELGEMLGVTVSGQNVRLRSSPRKLKNGEENWQPIIPPPPDAGTPPTNMVGAFDIVYEYTDLHDHVTHYVGRIEARGKKRKVFVPITFGTWNGVRGWHRKAPMGLKPLYGLNRLAGFPNSVPILCEGEKAADAAKLMFPDRPCLSIFGGCGQVEQNDYSPLESCGSLIYWPDADADGARAAETIRRKLPRARILRVDDLEDGDDAADVSPDDPEKWLADRLPPDPTGELRSFLAIETWADRTIPPPDRLLGDLVTTTTKMFLVGRTGLGKTMVGFGMATGIAAGTGFLHWRSARPGRVLYIDGEMPGDLIKARAIDALRRAGTPPRPGNLVIYSRDAEDEFAARFPTLGKMPPLNTEAGHNFVLALIAALGGVDLVIFDNVMSLITGDQKDEIPWSDTLPLVSRLTAKRIGQIWLDHTGHNSDRQYGSATKAWRFDTVGLMTPLSEDRRGPHELAVRLSFEHPGKARRRTPDNWRDFEACAIRLDGDEWKSDFAKQAHTKKLSPLGAQYHKALLDALAVSMTPGRTTRTYWYGECVRSGLAEAIDEADDPKDRSKKQSGFRKYVAEIKTAGLIGVDGETITDLRAPK